MLDPEWAAHHKPVCEAFAARARWLGDQFSDKQQRYLNEFQQQTPQEEQLNESDLVYKRAQQETDVIVREVMEILQLINGLVECVYQCGTLLDRIENHLTTAETYIDKGIANEEYVMNGLGIADKDVRDKIQMPGQKGVADQIKEKMEKEVKKRIPCGCLIGKQGYFAYIIIIANFILNIIYFIK